MPVYKNVTKRVYFQSLLTTGADNTATTPTVNVVKDGGAQVAATNTPSHLGTGQWMLVLTATEMNADEVSVNHSATGCVSGVVTVYPEADYTSTRAGLVDNLNATITSRMASYTQPTGFLTTTFGASVGTSTYAGGAVASVTGNVGGNVVGSVASVTARVTANADQLAGQTVTAASGVTFPTSVASPTNITAGTITTVTNLTNAATAGDLTAAMKTSVTTAATAATPVAASVTGNVGGSVASVTADVGITQTGADKVWGTATRTITGGTIGTYTGNTPQTGDSYARLGAPVGASHSADVAAVKAVLPSALVSGRMDASVGAMAAGVQTTASFAVGAIDSTVLSSNAEQAIADKTLATAVDGTITLRQLLQLIGASAVGKLSGAATTTVTIRNVSDTVNAAVVTVDADGNRSAATYTVT